MDKIRLPIGGVTLFAENLNRSYDECDRWRDQALAKIEVLRPAVVVLANSSHYVTGNRRTAASTTSALWQAGLETTIGRLSAADIRVAIIGDTPWPTGNVPFCLSKAIWHNARADTCAFDPVDEARAALRSIETAVAARFANARYLRTDELVCPISPCPVLQDGVVAYVDDNHISATLSRRLGEALADRITTLFPVR